VKSYVNIRWRRAGRRRLGRRGGLVLLGFPEMAKAQEWVAVALALALAQNGIHQ
jgi:hypothetical protein